MGRALINHAVTNLDWSITVFSRDYMKQAAVKRMFPNEDIRFVLGDVQNYDQVYMATVGHDLVIHAAAQKHIPAGEQYPADTIGANVHGSENVCAAAVAAGVDKVVGISTDKACYPVNVYGASKLMMERVFEDYGRRSPHTRFALCRYGNVLGSTGSVLQVWKRQIENGEPVTITDPNMTRFWLSEYDAVDLVMAAVEYGSEGTPIIVPMAPGMSIKGLAESFLEAVGVTGDYSIETIGKRPGEKDHECLVTDEEVENTFALNDWMWIIDETKPTKPVALKPQEFYLGYYSNNPARKWGAEDLQEILASLEEEPS